MELKNYYPEKPMRPFKNTPVSLSQLTDVLKSVEATKEVKRMVYVILRNESANGKKINNNNPAGIQADSGRWSGGWDSHIVGVFQKKENGTNKLRYFLAFDTLKNAIGFVCDRVSSRGIFIGGYAHMLAKRTIKDDKDLASAYKQEWVSGDSKAIPTKDELKNFLSMYNQAEKLFI